MGDVLIEEISRGMGAARCICKTNAKLAINNKERTKWKSILFSLFLLSDEIVSSHDEIFTSFR